MSVLLSCTQFSGNIFATQKLEVKNQNEIPSLQKVDEKSHFVKKGLEVATGILLALATYQNIDYYLLKDHGVDKKYIKTIDSGWFKETWYTKNCCDSTGKYYTWHRYCCSPDLYIEFRRKPMPIVLKGYYRHRDNGLGKPLSNISEILFMIDRPKEKYFIKGRYCRGWCSDIQTADPFFVSPLKTILLGNCPFTPAGAYEEFDGERWAKDVFNTTYDEVLYNFWRIYYECLDFQIHYGDSEDGVIPKKEEKLAILNKDRGSKNLRESTYEGISRVLNAKGLNIQKAREMIKEFGQK